MINDFFNNNFLIIRVLYAILFFLYAFAIVLKLNRRSELNLAKSLWLLAIYGIFFGVVELIIITRLVKSHQLSAQTIYWLDNAELFFRAAAFMVMLWLGIRLVSEILPRMRYLYWVGSALSLMWIWVAMYTLVFSHDRWYVGMMDNLSRYIFALPGLLMTGYGLLLHVREVEKFKIPNLIKHIKGLAYTFFAGAFLVGMIATHPVLWPAVILNRDTFMNVVGIPVIFFRSIYLVFVTYFVVRIVDVFEVEREYRLEEALKRQVLGEERDRIARELHDGIIQSIYGVGLKLTQHALLCEKDPAEANRQLSAAKNDLDRIIHDIRDYVDELHLEDYSCVSFREALTQLVDDFKDRALMEVDFAVTGKQAGDLNIVKVNHIIQIVRELLTNAAKHARASLVRVRVTFREQDFIVHVSDNGVGFNPDTLNSFRQSGEKQGLENAFHRITMLQGIVVFHSAPGHGTRFEITFPYSKLNYLQTAFVQSPGYFEAKAE